MDYPFIRSNKPQVVFSPTFRGWQRAEEGHHRRRRPSCRCHRWELGEAEASALTDLGRWVILSYFISWSPDFWVYLNIIYIYIYIKWHLCSQDSDIWQFGGFTSKLWHWNTGTTKFQPMSTDWSWDMSAYMHDICDICRYFGFFTMILRSWWPFNIGHR